MSPADTLTFAVRALTAHRLRTALSLLGMAIGVAAVVLLTALGEGAQRYVTGQFASLGSNLVIVVPGKTETTGALPGVGGAPHDLTLEDAIAVSRLRRVHRVAPVVVGTETVGHRERKRQVAVIGSTSTFLALRDLHLDRGRFLPPGELERGSPVVVLGYTLAHDLFPNSDPLGQVVRIGGWRFKVIGILTHRGEQLGVNTDEVAVVPVATGMRMFNRASLFRLMVEARQHGALDDLQSDIIALLRERHGEEDVTVLTQEAVLASFKKILGALTLAVAAIAAISLAVAGIGIMNVMLVSVSERTSEVGLLKALGAYRGQIQGVFLVEAMALSLAGGVVGLGVGWIGVGVLVRLFPALPAGAPTWAVLAALGTALFMGTLFGVLPARRASRLDPVAALAHR